MITVLSLGAGVQSSCLALMMAAGELPAADHAVFADTGAEPAAVYAYLDWLEARLPFPVHRVSAGNLRDDLLSSEPGRFASIPAFTLFRGSVGMTRRQCTREYKIEPIRRKVRELIGLAPGQRGPRVPVVRQVIGISLDEIQRIKDSGSAYVENVYPLIDRRMTRRDCLAWMEARGYPLPGKSSCTFCPYHDDAMWRAMRDGDAGAWSDAVAVDRALRGGAARAAQALDADIYLHRSCVPLDQVDLSTAEDAGQGVFGFVNECEGVCGV